MVAVAVELTGIATTGSRGRAGRRVRGNRKFAALAAEGGGEEFNTFFPETGVGHGASAASGAGIAGDATVELVHGVAGMSTDHVDFDYPSWCGGGHGASAAAGAGCR